MKPNTRPPASRPAPRREWRIRRDLRDVGAVYLVRNRLSQALIAAALRIMDPATRGSFEKLVNDGLNQRRIQRRPVDARRLSPYRPHWRWDVN